MRRGKRRLLVVSWHFGTSGATGGFRWAHMARHMAGMGWSVDVLTASEPVAPPVPGVRIHRIPPVGAVERLVDGAGRIGSLAKRALGAARSRSRLTEAGAVTLNSVMASPPHAPASPDAAALVLAALDAAPYMAWNRRAVRHGTRLARRTPFEAVVVSSPPHLTLMAGARLGRRLGIPFVADLRDAWIAGLSPEHLARMPAADRILGERYEPAVARSASLLIHNTERATAAAAAALPEIAVRRATVRNGSDCVIPALPPDPERFRVLFSGWIYDYMDLRALLAGFGRFLRRRKPGDAAVLEFQGAPDRYRGEGLRELAAAAGVAAPHLHFSERVPRTEAHGVQMRASLLVAFDCLEPICVPMKVYDYVCMQGELLLLGHRDGAMADIAREVGRCVVSPADERGIDAVFDEAYERWIRNEWRGPHDPGGLLSRERQSMRMAELLEELGEPARVAAS